MGNKHQQLKLHQSFIFNPKWYKTFALGLFAFLCAYVTASILTPVQTSDASTVIINNTLTGYYVKITSADDLIMNVDASPVGQLKSIKDTVNVVTNSPNGYNLYVSTSTPDNNIYQNGDSSTASQGYFRPSSGTTTSPAPLEKDTWGFALNKSNNTYGANFADVTKYADSGVPDATSTWSAVPNADNLSDAHISSADSPNYEDGTDVDIYYGISASTSLPTGSYSGIVTYTAFSEGVNQFAYMQDFTAKECGQMVTGQSVILSDSRDGKYYRITKLADSNCWMTQNLALDGADEFGRVRTLTPADSNVTSNVTLTPTATSGESNMTSIQIWGQREGYNGNYYNWCAATALATGCDTTTEPTTSICPKGWRLPSGSGSYSYKQLFNAVGISNYTQVEAEPYYVTRAGYYNSGYGGLGTLGAYWSRSLLNADSVAYFLLRYSDSNFELDAYGARSVGVSVRCVFDQSSTSMQDFTAASCTALGSEASTTLMDKRDGKEYRITKLKDGNCWMTDNLALDGSRTLTAADSNVTQSRTLPANISNGTASQYDVAQIYSGNANSTTTDCGTNAYCVVSDVKYGNLYNWNAATATVGLQSTAGTVTESVCPKGWQLPNNTGTKSFISLANAYDFPTTTHDTITDADKAATIAIQKSPLNFPTAGMYSNRFIATVGYYWSNTVNNSGSNNAFHLGFHSGNGSFGVQNYNPKRYGFSVRCVFGS